MNSERLWGLRMSFRATMFSCRRCLNSLISRSVRLASVALSKAFEIFLIATFSCVSSFFALQDGVGH